MGGKKSKPTIGYWYKLAIHFLWGKAADVLLEIRGGDKTAWSGFQDESGTISIAAKNLWGGEKAEGGIEGDMDVMMGEATQSPNTYLGTVFGSKNPAFRGKATAVFKGGLYGAFNPYPKPMSFKVRRIFTDWPGACWYAEKAAVPYYSQLDAPEPVYEDVAIVDLHSQSNASTTLSPPPVNAVVLSGFNPTDVVVCDFPSGQTYEAWRYDGTSSYYTDFNVTDAEGNDRHYFTGSPAFLTAAAALAYRQSQPDVTFSGSTSYAFWIADTYLPDNVGGVSIRVRKYSVGEATQPYGMNPAHILYESIVSGWGLGEPESLIDEASFLAAADRLYDEGFALCMRFDPRHQTVEQLQRRIEQIVDGRLTQSRVDGKYYLTLIRDDYVIEDLPILTDDDILEFRQEDSDPLESVNQVMVEWFDPEQKEKRITPPVTALAAVRSSGGIVSETGAYPEFPYEDLALRIGNRDLAYKSRPQKRFSLTTNRTPYNWLGGQLFRLQAPRRGIADMVCLVGEISAGVPRSASMRLKVSQHMSALRSTVYVTGEPGVDHTPSPTPVATATQQLIEAPYTKVVERLSAADLGSLSTDAGFALAMAKRPTDGLSYALYTGAGSEDLVDRGYADFCPTALVVEAADRYETTFTLSNGSDLADVVVGTLALWGSELVRVDAIDADALTVELGRGCADTVGQVHSAGERIWFIDDGCGSDGREYADGEVVHAKLLTRTSSAELALADATEVTATMDSRAARPYPPAKLLIDGLVPGAAVSETFTLSWFNRDRVLQADQLVDQEAASIGPESNTRYTVQVINDATDAVVLELADLAGTSVDILLAADHAALRIEMFATRNGLQSWQTNSTPVFAYTAGAEGAAYGGANPGSPGTGTGTPATNEPSEQWAEASGTDTITATYAETPTLANGLELRWRAAGANTGAATFNPNGLGAWPLRKYGNTALAAGDVPAAGYEATVRCNADDERWELLNPAASVGSGGDVAGDTHAATSKSTPVDADELPLADSAASYALKKLTWANLKAGVWNSWGSLINGGTGKTTPVDADAIALMDSAASNATKRLTLANLATWVGTKLGALINGSTAKTTPVNADEIVIADSAASSATKKVSLTDFKAFLKTYFDTVYSTGGGGSGAIRGTPVITETAVQVSTSSIIPLDNTIPQNTEGAEFTQLATTYTPTDASSILEVLVEISQYQLNTNANGSAALFQDSNANAIAAVNVTPAFAGYSGPIILRRRLVAGSTTARTFKFRYGPNGGTMYLNQRSDGNSFNGVIYSRMKVTEYAP